MICSKHRHVFLKAKLIMYRTYRHMLRTTTLWQTGFDATRGKLWVTDREPQSRACIGSPSSITLFLHVGHSIFFEYNTLLSNLMPCWILLYHRILTLWHIIKPPNMFCHLAECLNMLWGLKELHVTGNELFWPSRNI